MPKLAPPHLKEKAARGELVFFAGAGLSRPAGLPGWEDLIREGVKFATRRGCEVDEEQIERLIEKKNVLSASGLLRCKMGENLFAAFLVDVFHKRGAQPTAAHALLTGLRCVAILTTNFDRLIESASIVRNLAVQPDAEALLHQVSQGELPGAVVKVHGDVSDHKNVVFAAGDFQKHLTRFPALAAALQTVFHSRTCVFLGYSLRDPEITGLLADLHTRTGGHTGPHYALMSSAGLEPQEVREYRENYGIEFLDGYDNAEGYPDIVRFLTELRGDPQVSDAEVRDIESLLGLQPQRWKASFRERVGDAAMLSVALPSAFGDTTDACFRYVPRAATSEDLRIWPDGAGERALVSRDPLPPGVLEHARNTGVRCFSRGDLIRRLANFDKYLESLRADYEKDEIDRYFVPLDVHCGPDDGPVEQTNTEALDAFLARWLAEPRAKMLSLLGAFGTGKSWLCRRLAYRASKDTSPDARIPLLIRLREHPRDVRSLLWYALERFRVEIGSLDAFDRLNREGRLLLIFDGFDEMERRANDYKTAIENFEQIASLVTPQSKVVLTCRTEFFQNRAEERLTHERGQERALKSAQSAAETFGVASFGVETRPGFEIAHLARFTEEQVKSALRLRAPEKWEELWEKVRALPATAELTDRPVLIRMIVETMDRILGDAELNLATLYEGYTSRLLAERDPGDLPYEKRLFFVKELAWSMMERGRLAVPFSEFPALVMERFGLEDKPVEAAVFEREIRNHSYLERDAAGNYEFPHKSIMEYFVATKLAPLLTGTERVEIRLTDAVVAFLPDLLRGYEHPKRVWKDDEYDMVWVPPGPFVYGSEAEDSLRVEFLEKGFWIDRFPVTNARYLAFLEKQGNQTVEGAPYLDHDWSKIKKTRGKFVLEKQEYGEHPATGVTWYGAKAFAEWSGGRLPKEEEWEKAARGVDGRNYPWGQTFHQANCNTEEGGPGGTTPVGKYGLAGVSPYGAEDMAGNVWEWTSSNWKGGSPALVLRGGSWNLNHGIADCAFRILSYPANRVSGTGFRCSRT